MVARCKKVYNARSLNLEDGIVKSMNKKQEKDFVSRTNGRLKIYNLTEHTFEAKQQGSTCQRSSKWSYVEPECVRPTCECVRVRVLHISYFLSSYLLQQGSGHDKKKIVSDTR